MFTRNVLLVVEVCVGPLVREQTGEKEFERKRVAAVVVADVVAMSSKIAGSS